MTSSPDTFPDAFEQRLFELATDALVVCALDGEIRSANPAAGRLTGVDAAALRGGSLWDVVHEEDRDRVRGLFAAGEPGEPPRHDEFRLRIARPGGEIRWAEVRAVVDRDAGLCHLVGRDVTERIAADVALAENEAKLADAQQLARLGSWERVLESGEVTWSDELFRVHGLRPQPGPQPWERLLEQVHPDDRDRVARTVEQGIAEGGVWSIDHRIVRPDGAVRMVQARGEVLPAEEGRPAVAHGTCQDVTEARQVEDAQRAAEQLFRRAFDDAPIGMALIDLEGRWLRLNRAIARMAGRTEAELRETPPTELIHPDDAAADEPLVRELLAGRRRTFAVERRLVSADGTALPVLAHVSLLHGDGERPLYFLVQLVDAAGGAAA